MELSSSYILKACTLSCWLLSQYFFHPFILSTQTQYPFEFLIFWWVNDREFPHLKTAWFEPFSWYVHSLMILNLPFCYTKEEKLLVTLPAWSYYENIFIIWGNLCKWSMLHREKGLCQFFLSQAHCNLLFAYNKLLEALSWSRVPDLIWSISLLDLTWRPTLAFL